MKFSVFQVSRKGGRQKNEDRMGYSYTRDAGLFLLADGMGGHPEGEVAAQIALQAISSMFQNRARPTLPDVKAFLDEAIFSAHRQMLAYAGSKHMPDCPRTTVVACVVQEGAATWAHCGDSRLYLVRRGGLQKRTRDHSYAEYPEIGTSLGRQVANRNVLFTCLGSPVRPMVDMSDTTPLEGGDRVILCSDGLWSVLSDREIAKVLGAHPVAESVPELVERALRGAGAASDNVTAVAFEWEASEAGAGLAGAQESASDDGFASTTPTELQDRADRDELDEAAIERSIAEINEAIRRTALRSRR
ncbi:PP2C family serine/threonine-protein phosphatase [Xylophilus sp. GOD-11R]|uniref:PP2C family protein-serine/threonine phosphatase n=1 Tax=Xylophilus sp. GOD-11R TaxID=3089814 RepID=UPI00298CCD5E|nr:PP2C family serine/threonine-protein phosphatase [Xylophilus sp. GOD-11R]WPB55929.1 PP2C family serine/threonine-protein phosphatase [Xylophilus sp. GOD-11R]